jgi:hypothetical protein
MVDNHYEKILFWTPEGHTVRPSGAILRLLVYSLGTHILILASHLLIAWLGERQRGRTGHCGSHTSWGAWLLSMGPPSVSLLLPGLAGSRVSQHDPNRFCAHLLSSSCVLGTSLGLGHKGCISHVSHHYVAE